MKGTTCIKGVGVVRDKDVKLEDGKTSHTQGGTGQGGTYLDNLSKEQRL